ncbi:hypothetical protein DUNSADRAFT_6307 [Dunaliella salina]|uniref:Encoded protein n=1 Tax=Dunaliella salina TaxID=3046 RepID=A0ABQ7FTU5_DUNSA|nr:hypothetical protein DUNSADRAFT_6307 [Dunaliella salina]|eukprot:KAF5825862.1 hypothetical protein DUNSADRAFT_6307 [Dunaliella salina]
MLHQQCGKHAVCRGVPYRGVSPRVKSRRALRTLASSGQSVGQRIAIVDYGVKSQRGTVRKVGDVGVRDE